MSLAVGYDGGDSAKGALVAAISLARDLDETLLIVCGVAPAGGWARSTPRPSTP